MKKQLVWLTAVPLLAACDLDLTGLGSCEYDESWTESVSASGIASLRVLAEAGHVRVEGVNGSNAVRVRATACSDDPDDLDEIDFDFFYDGATLDVESFVPNRDNARLDLVIEVPSDFGVALFHEEGDIDVRGVDVVYVDDGSGHIDIENIRFDVDILDESGDIDINGVGGDVTIEDGSGDIDVDDVGGDLIVRYDTSGNIRHRNVRGRVDLP